MPLLGILQSQMLSASSLPMPFDTQGIFPLPFCKFQLLWPRVSKISWGQSFMPFVMSVSILIKVVSSLTMRQPCIWHALHLKWGSLDCLLGKEHLDLLVRIWRRRHLVCFELHKVKSHRDLADISDPMIRYQCMGNRFADQIAVDVRDKLVPCLVAEHQTAHSELEFEQKHLSAIYKLYLQLLEARGRAQAPEVPERAEQCDNQTAWLGQTAILDGSSLVFSDGWAWAEIFGTHCIWARHCPYDNWLVAWPFLASGRRFLLGWWMRG